MKRTIASLCTAVLAVPIALSATASVSAEEATAAATPTVSAAATSTGRLVPLTPTRILDTRTGVGAPVGALPADGSLDLQVTGAGGVPADATAVVLNVTIVDSVGAGYVQALPTPAGDARGKSSNLNVERAGQTIPNLVIVPIGMGGQVTLYGQAGGHLVADVLGAFVPAATSTEGRYEALVPTRLLDTRDGTGAPAAKLGPQGSIDLQVTGAGGADGVPASGVSAVALNVTATEATGEGYVQVVPTGGATALGTSSNLNASAGQTIANLVIVPVGANGKVTLYTSAGTHLLADVTGWFTDATGADTAVGLFTPVTPARLLDTRGGTRPAADSTTPLPTAGQAGVPSAGVAAVALNVTATVTAAPGFVQAYPAGTLQQGKSSTLNVERSSQTIPNAAIATLGTGGVVNLYAQSGTHLLADVSGWFSSGFSVDPGNPVDPGPGTPPALGLSLPYVIPGLSPRLIFNTEAETPKPAQSVGVSNTGGTPLQVSLSISGTQPGSFAIEAGTELTFTLAPGASRQVPVLFTPPGATPPHSDRTKHHTANLVMATHDPAGQVPDGSLGVVLRGLDAEGFEGVNEPWLADVTKAIGYVGIDPGWAGLEVPTDPASPDPLNPIPLTGVPIYGDQVAARAFKRADPSQPVVLLPLGSYTARHVAPNTGDVQLHSPGGAFFPSSSNLLTFAADTGSAYVENQKLLPQATGTTTFNPPAPAGGQWPNGQFGLKVEDNFSLQNGSDPACVAIRTYPAQVSNTNVLPHAYVVAADLDCVNGDYNDYVFLIANVVPQG